MLWLVDELASQLRPRSRISHSKPCMCSVVRCHRCTASRLAITKPARGETFAREEKTGLATRYTGWYGVCTMPYSTFRSIEEMNTDPGARFRLVCVYSRLLLSCRSLERSHASPTASILMTSQPLTLIARTWVRSGSARAQVAKYAGEYTSGARLSRYTSFTLPLSCAVTNARSSFASAVCSAKRSASTAECMEDTLHATTLPYTIAKVIASTTSAHLACSSAAQESSLLLLTKPVRLELHAPTCRVFTL
mmetsp:Transcript_12543/g.31690  ORF Transcript_12543/g.31690 Transcript_12543/m.31690 type:complete len:250 (-) Transcript_12543:354-1103(-)